MKTLIKASLFAIACLTTAPISVQCALGDSPGVPMGIMPESIEPDFAPRLGTYYYRFHWLLRIGAEAEISITRIGDDYSVATTVKTGWIVDRFYRLRYRGAALMAAGDLSPIRVDIREEVRSTRKKATMEYRDGMIYSERIKTKKDKKPRHESYRHSTRDGRVMDPFSATLIARAVPWAVGDLRTIDVFDGRRMNQVKMECVGQTRVEAGDWEYDVLIIRLSITQGDPEDLDEDDELITDQVTVFLTDDQYREVVGIEADTKFGGIKVYLESFQPAP